MTPIRTLRPLAKVVLSTQSDERLVALSRQGSEDAFAEIVRRYRPGLLRLALSLGSGDRADDVVQDGLVRAWRALQGSDAEIDLRAWLTTIVRNRALTAHSANRVHEELDETIDGVRQPGDIVIMREELRSAVSAVNSLPDTQREALVRSALSGESHDQIATALATTPGAVRQLIFRARTGLREAVGAIVPFPIVRALADIGIGGVATGGTAAALTAGGSFGLKALTVVAIGAGVAGSGVALQRHTSGAEAKERSATTKAQRTDAESTSVSPPAPERSAHSEQAGSEASAGQDADEATAAKSTPPTRSASLISDGSSRGGTPRVADSGEATVDDDGEQSSPHGSPAGVQTQPQQPAADPHTGGAGQPVPPREGGHQQQPPPPQTSETADSGGTGSHHPSVGDQLQPVPTDAHDGDGRGGGLLSDVVPAD